MTLGDRVGRATNSSHRTNGSAGRSRDDAPPPEPSHSPRPAFGPEPPHADETGPEFPGEAPVDQPVDGSADAWPNADDFWTAQQPASDDWHEQPADPFGDASSDEAWDAANPPWAEHAPPNGTSAVPPPPDGDPPPRSKPEPAAADDEVLPPPDDTGGAKQDEHPIFTVKALQPATVRAIGSAPEPVGRIGPPPSGATAAAVLSGLLAVPMLATAGALLGTGAGPVLPAALLVLTASCVAGGVRLMSRGSPLLPLFNAAVALAVTAAVLWLAPRGLTTALLTALWVLFLPLALAMVVLLRGRKVRRWLIARSRQWQADRPPTRSRRFRLPAVHITFPKLPRRDPTKRKARKPTTVRREGRHKRQRRGFRRRGPVSYVGNKAPDDR